MPYRPFRRAFRAAGWLALALLFGAMPLAAQTQLKLGFVNATIILEKAPQAEQARERLEKEFKPRDEALVSAQQELRDLEDQLAGEGGGYSDDERRRLEREIRSLRREIDRMEDEFKEDFNLRRNEELRKLQRLVYEAIVELAKEEGFDLIVNQDAVIFASERVDVTESVLTRLQQGQPAP